MSTHHESFSMISQRPRRSILYMPASNARALEKAKTLKADGFVFDLEDSVRPDAKLEARANAVAASASGAYGNREIIIRCNALDTQWGGDDLQAIATSGADGILVPKISGVDDVHLILAMLDDAGAPSDIGLWLNMETPAAFLRADAICGASDRIKGLVMGTNDLIKDMQARHVVGRANILPALTMAILAARTHGLMVLDSVYNQFKDIEGFETECEQARNMGCDGKSLIHPSQVDIANGIFGASEAEIAEAKEIIEAFDKAFAAGDGMAVVNGEMIEALHADEARRVVALAEMISELQE